MKLNDYQNAASGTAVYPGRMSPLGIMYCVLKMNGEAGELAGHFLDAKTMEKYVQGDIGFRPDRRELLIKEVGDVMWYIAALSDELQTTLQFVYGGEPPVSVSPSRIADEVYMLSFQTGQIAEIVGKAMRDEGFGMPTTYARGVLRTEDLPPITHEQVGASPHVIAEISLDRRVKIIALMRKNIQSLLYICASLDISLHSAMEINIKKLASRKARGTLQGNGDNR